MQRWRVTRIETPQLKRPPPSALSIPTEIVGSLMVAMTAAVFSVSFAVIIYGAGSSEHLALGLTFTLLGSAAALLVTGVFGSLKGAISHCQDANALFTDLTAEILNARGTVDKYIGDSIMAFWNAPVPVDGHQRLACQCALMMRERLSAFSRTRQNAGLSPVRMATGLAAGRACVGNMGSRDRFNYSVVGDVVNEAARIEAACRHLRYDIVASKDVVDRAPELATLYSGALDLKGIANRTETFLITGSDEVASSDSFRQLSMAHTTLVKGLENGADCITEVARCKELCAAVDPNLMNFYSAVLENREDFNKADVLAQSA